MSAALNKVDQLAIGSALEKVGQLSRDTAPNKVALLSEGTALKEVPVLSAPLTMSLAEVSSALGLLPRALQRKHRAMSRDHGFPPPIPGGVWMWSRAAFEAWIRANGVQSVELDADEPTATAANDRTVGLVRSQNESLRARYAGGR